MTLNQSFLYLCLALSVQACASTIEPHVKAVSNAADAAEILPAKLAPKDRWDFKLRPIQASTEDADGALRMWHGRSSRKHYPSEQACERAAKKALDYMGGEAWNFEVACTSPPINAQPIQVMGANSIDLEK